MKFIKLGLASVAGMGALAIATPAEAFTLGFGEFSIDGSAVILEDPETDLSENFFFDTDSDQLADLGSFGDFQFEPPATEGAFEGFLPEGGEILSFGPETDLPIDSFIEFTTTSDVFVTVSLETLTLVEQTGDSLVVQGNGFITADDSSLPAIIDFSGEESSNFGDINSYSATVSVVPEPTTMAGTAIALGLGFLAKKRKEHNQG